MNIEEKTAFFNGSVEHWLRCGEDISRKKLLRTILQNWCEYSIGNVLDIGCGTGIASSVLSENGYSQEKLFLIDISAKMLDEVRKILPESNIVQSMGEQLPFSEEKFDKIILFDSLPHFEIKSLMNEIERVCAPRGKIIILHDGCHIKINRIHKNIGKAVEDAILPALAEMVDVFEERNFSVIKTLEWEKKLYLIQAIKKPAANSN